MSALWGAPCQGPQPMTKNTSKPLMFFQDCTIAKGVEQWSSVGFHCSPPTRHHCTYTLVAPHTPSQRTRVADAVVCSSLAKAANSLGNREWSQLPDICPLHLCKPLLFCFVHIKEETFVRILMHEFMCSVSFDPEQVTIVESA